MGKFKKGDEVWVISSYDGKGTVRIDRLTIQSWGKQRGTATLLSDGRYIDSAIYTPTAENPQPYHPHYYLVGSVDPNEAALAYAEKFLAHQRSAIAACRAHNHDAGPAYHAALDKDEAALHEPRVLFHTI